MRYLSIALVSVAFIFLVIGLARTVRLSAGPPGSEARIATTEVERLRRIQRVDWKCSVSLLGVAVVAYVVASLGTGPFFTEPSGNIAGGVLLIAAVVGLVLAILLLIRHIGLSRALRDLDA
jgi:hypothetical protein